MGAGGGGGVGTLAFGSTNWLGAQKKGNFSGEILCQDLMLTAVAGQETMSNIAVVDKPKLRKLQATYKGKQTQCSQSVNLLDAPKAPFQEF